MYEMRIRDIFMSEDTGIYFGVYTSNQYELFSKIIENGNGASIHSQKWELGKRFGMAKIVVHHNEADTVLIDDEGKWAYAKQIEAKDLWEDSGE